MAVEEELGGVTPWDFRQAVNAFSAELSSFAEGRTDLHALRAP